MTSRTPLPAEPALVVILTTCGCPSFFLRVPLSLPSAQRVVRHIERLGAGAHGDGRRRALRNLSNFAIDIRQWIVRGGQIVDDSVLKVDTMSRLIPVADIERWEFCQAASESVEIDFLVGRLFLLNAAK